MAAGKEGDAIDAETALGSTSLSPDSAPDPRPSWNGDASPKDHSLSGPEADGIPGNVNGAPVAESWEQVEQVQKLDEPLDLEQQWALLLQSEPANGADQVAKNIATELASFMLAGRAGGFLEREAERMMASAGVSADDFKITPENGSTSPNESSCLSGCPCDQPPTLQDDSGDAMPPIAMSSNRGPSANSVDKDACSSDDIHYGELLLQGLQNDAKRKLPKKDHGEMTLLLSGTLAKMDDMKLRGFEASCRTFSEAFTMEAMGPLLFTLVEARQIKNQPLADASSQLLYAVAGAGNPREVHVILKLAIAQISDHYLADVCTLIIDDLVNLWQISIPRITGSRPLFLKDVIEILDRVLFGKQADKDTSRCPTVLEKAVLRLVGDLVDQQRVRKQEMTEVGAALPPGHDADWVPGAAEWNELNGNRSDAPGMKDNKVIVELRKAVAEKETEVHAFETECGYTLALLMRLVESLVCRISSGPIDPGKSDVADKALAEALKSMVPMFECLGLLNPVDALQKFQRLLSLTPCEPENALTNAISCPKPRRKRKKETFFSVKAATCYLVCALLYGKQSVRDIPLLEPKGFHYNLTMATKSSATKVCAIVQESAFALLDPEYSLQLVLPYVMTLISDAVPYLTRIGAHILFAFLQPISRFSVGGLAEVLYTPYDTSFGQSDVSVFGVASVLVKAIARCDFGEDREYMMATLRLLLTKFAKGKTRFCMLESLMLQADRVQMSGEIVKQMKDAVVAVDAEENELVASMYRTRLVEAVLPRWLLPRKEVLNGIHAAVTTCNMVYFVAVSDARKAQKLAEDCSRPADGPLEIALAQRMRFTYDWAAVGLKMIERLVSCAHHDKLRADELERSKNVVSAAEGKELLKQAHITMFEGGNAIDRLQDASRVLKGGLKQIGPPIDRTS